jgi:two-component system sensor histidine kinase KdpD
VAQRAPDADIVQTGRSDPVTRSTSRQEDASGLPPRSKSRQRYLLAAAACALTTVLAAPLLPYLDLANIVMLFLLAEVLVAVRCGRGPAVLAAFMSVAAFDFFFVPPRLSFAVSDVQYLVTFAVMLIVALTVGQLTAGLRFQANIALRREARARALYEYARALSAALQAGQIQEVTSEFMQKGFRAKAALLLPDAAGRLQMPLSSDCPGQALPAGLDPGIAQWAFDHGAAAGIGTDTLPGSRLFYLPLPAPMRLRGVMALEPESRRWLLIPEQRQQLDTFAALAAIALERVHYIEVAQDALLHMESERLRNSLLAALSHDLRTPLTSLVGMSEALAMTAPPLAPQQQVLAQQLREEAGRMARLVSNVLDMARIQGGDVRLNLQWQPIEEVVGSALRACGAALAGYQVGTRLPADLPLVHFDAVLIERVLCNLLENAARYTPPGSCIVIGAATVDAALEVTVSDNGPGLPAGRESELFEKFTRGEKESASPGVGLGLAICKAIVEAHHGVIRAGRSAEGGAAMVFTLPLGTPPPFDPIDAEQAAMGKPA